MPRRPKSRPIPSSALSTEYAYLPELFGRETGIQLALLWGGSNVYLPRRPTPAQARLSRESRLRCPDMPHAAPAAGFQPSDRQLRQMLKSCI